MQLLWFRIRLLHSFSYILIYPSEKNPCTHLNYSRILGTLIPCVEKRQFPTSYSTKSLVKTWFLVTVRVAFRGAVSMVPG